MEGQRAMGSKLEKAVVFILVVVSLLSAGPMFALADDYPSRPIIINSGMSPGGVVGNNSQVFAEYAKKYLPKEQTILVNYKPGASGMLAADYILSQPADGYNLIVNPPDFMAKVAVEGDKLKFTLDDFFYIGTLAASASAIGIKKDSPYARLEDFVAFAKKNPNKLSIGTVGQGSYGQLISENFQEAAGIKLKHIPYTGSGPGSVAALGGHVDSFLGTVTGFKPYIEQDPGLKVTVIFSRERLEDYPDFPTCVEKGIDVVFDSWTCLAAPRKTPQPVLNILMDVVKKTVQDPGYKEAVRRIGCYVVKPNLLGAEAEKRVKAEYEIFKTTYKKLGMIK